MSLVFLAFSIVSTFVCYLNRAMFLGAKMAYEDPSLRREMELVGLHKGVFAEENCERAARSYEYAMAVSAAIGVAAFLVAVVEASR